MKRIRYIEKNSHQPQPLTIYNVMARSICFLFGHKIGAVNEGGYPICDRCWAYSYWDYQWNSTKKWQNAGWLRIDWFIKRKYYQIKGWYLCLKRLIMITLHTLILIVIRMLESLEILMKVQNYVLYKFLKFIIFVKCKDNCK